MKFDKAENYSQGKKQKENLVEEFILVCTYSKKSCLSFFFN